MKFIITREPLLKPLQMVNGVVEKRQTLHILSHVLLTVHDGRLALTATDLEVQMHTQIEVDQGEEGEITLPVRKFLDICRALPEQAEIRVTVQEERATICSGKSRFTLTTLPAGEFPSIETKETILEFSLPQSTLKRALERTYFAMAQQDVRYYLNGMLLELAGDQIRLVATDGHRLAYCELQNPIKILENQYVIIPRKAVLELVRLLGDEDNETIITLGSNFVRVSTPEMCFTTKLIDGRFPEYQNVLPLSGENTLTCDRDLLRQALHRVSILSNEKYRGVRMALSDRILKVSAHNPEHEEAEEEVSVNYEGNPMEIGFNVNYLLDAVMACETGKVQIQFSDPNSCCLIRGMGEERCKYVVMPMRL